MSAGDGGASPGRLLTKADLAEGDLTLWRDWLQSGVIAFTTGTTSEERRRAFTPFSIDPTSSGPAGALAKEIRLAVRQANSAPSNAAIEVLRRWSPAYEGWEGAAFLIELSTRLGARDLYPALLRLLDRVETLSEAAQHELAFLCTQSADERLKRTEVIGLMRKLEDLSLLRPHIVADFAQMLARSEFGGLDEIPATLLLALPSLGEPPHLGNMASAIARRLQQEFPADRLMRALEPHDGDEASAEKLRAELQVILYPKETHPFFRLPSIKTQQEFEAKTGIAADRKLDAEKSKHSDDQ